MANRLESDTLDGYYRTRVKQTQGKRTGAEAVTTGGSRGSMTYPKEDGLGRQQP